jgi:hypothetical protein
MPYIGVSPFNGVRRKHTYTATASQTSFSGAGTEGATLSYTDSTFVDVFQNGVKLGEADYTATSGTAIVLAQGASLNDLVEVVVYDVFSVADTVSKSAGGTFDGNITAAGTLGVTGNATVGGTLGVTGSIDLSNGILASNGSVQFVMDKDNNGGEVFVWGHNASDATTNELMRLSDSGNLTIANGLTLTDGNVTLASGHGIDFSANSNAAGMTSELLDSYEEGTWTCTVTGSTSNPSTAVTEGGTYTKIGRMVYAHVQLSNKNTSGAAGGVRITGLPFEAGADNQATGNLMTYVGVSMDVDASNISPYVGGTGASFYASKHNAGWAEITHNAVANFYLSFSVTYVV